MRDEDYTPFAKKAAERPRREAITVLVMARLRGDQTDSMRGSLRADLATHQDALAAAGWYRCCPP